MMKRLAARTSVSVLHHRTIRRILTAATIAALGAITIPQSQGVHAQVGGGQFAGPTGLNEGQVYTGQLGTFTDSLCKAHSYYTATVDWGDGHTDVAPIVGTCTYTVNDTHVYQEEGNYILKVSVRSSADGSVVQFSGNVAVADAALNPGQQLTVPFTEGTVQNATLIGSFTDADQFTNPATGTPVCDGTASDYKVSIDWGDGTKTDSTTGKITSLAGTFCGFNVLGSHRYAEEGQYTYLATVTDAGGSSAVVSGLAIVGDAALSNLSGSSFHGVEGTRLTSQYVGTFTDSDGGCQAADYTASINWGDGSPFDTTTARIYPSSHTTVPCAFDVYGTHTYTEESPAGGYILSTLVTDATSVTTLSGVATIADARLVDLQTASLVDPATSTALLEGVSYNGIYLGTVHDTNFSPDPANGCLASDYQVAINWGDGSPLDTTTGAVVSPSVAQPGFCNFDITGNHTYSEEKFSGYPVTVTVTDIGGGPSVGNSVVTLVDNAVVQDNPLVAVASEQLGYGSDPVGPLTEGAPFTRVVAVFNDPDPYCTLNDVLANPASAEDFGATINWGDGTALSTVNSTLSAAGQIVPDATLGGCNFDVIGNHIYDEETAPGQLFHLVITIHDTPYNKIVIDDTAIVGPTTAQVGDAPVTPPVTPPSFGTPCTSNVLSEPTCIIEGVPYHHLLLGTFHDTAGDGGDTGACDVSDYAATIDWGDGAATESLVPGASEPVIIGFSENTYGVIVPSADNNPCDFDVLGNYTYEEQGTFSIGIQIYDAGTGSPPGGTPVTGWSDAVTVSDALLNKAATNNFQPVEGHPTVSTLQNQPAGFQYLGTFTDNDPLCHATDYQVTVDWSDGVPGLPGSPDTETLGPGLPDPNLKIVQSNAHSAANCSFDVYGVHTYTEESQDPANPAYTVTVTVNDVIDNPGDSATTTWTDAANVVDAQISKLAAHNISAVEGSVNGVIPSTNTYLGTIHDSANNATTCTTANDFFNETGLSHNGAVTVNWGDGTSDVLTGNADAPNPAGGLGMLVIQPATGAFGQADPNGCNFDIFGTHTYVEESEPNLPYKITVTVLDAGGSTTSFQDLATVADAPLQQLAPPVPLLTNCDLLSNQGDPCTGVIATFQDPVVDNAGNLACDSEANPVVNSALLPPGTPESIPFHYTVSINWGDGSPADTKTGVVQEIGGTPNGTCQFEVIGTHSYTTPGNFNVQATITDEGHLVGSNDGAVITANSPTADTIAVTVPPATAPIAKPYGSAVVQYSYPNVNTPTYVFNLALYSYQSRPNGGVPAVGGPPPYLLGHTNFYDRQAFLSIPGPVAGGIDPGAVDPRGCQNTFSPIFQCQLTPLSVVCANPGPNGYSPFPAGKEASIWIQYKYTLPPHTPGSVVFTRYARYDLQDNDSVPGKPTDNFQITMSSGANPAVAQISNPPSPPDNHVFVTC